MFELPKQKRIVRLKREAPIPKGVQKWWIGGQIVYALNEKTARKKYAKIDGNYTGSCERLD